MIPVLGGALTLVLLELVISSPYTAPRLGQLGATLSHAVARFVDPTVPMIGPGGTTAPAGGTAPTPVTPAAPAGPTQAPRTPAGTAYPTS